jgi:4'-phosphopantetheinyl transferase
LASAPALAFNLSVSWPTALFAFAEGHEVGVDIETIRPVDGASAIAQSHFTEREQAAAAQTPADVGRRAFLRIWTRKEALVKALGIGLALPLSAFDVLDQPTYASKNGGDPGPSLEGWSLVDLGFGPNHAAAICIPRGWELRLSSSPRR